VKNLVTNNTAKSFINNVDLNLIDPYKISDMDDDNKSSKEKLLHIGNKQKTIKSGTKKTNSKFFFK